MGMYNFELTNSEYLKLESFIFNDKNLKNIFSKDFSGIVNSKGYLAIKIEHLDSPYEDDEILYQLQKDKCIRFNNWIIPIFLNSLTHDSFYMFHDFEHRAVKIEKQNFNINYFNKITLEDGGFVKESENEKFYSPSFFPNGEWYSCAVSEKFDVFLIGNTFSKTITCFGESLLKGITKNTNPEFPIYNLV